MLSGVSRLLLSICSMVMSPVAITLSLPRGSLMRMVTSLLDLMSGTAPENTTVPDVIGDDYASAKSELESAGFEVTRQEADSEQAKSTVLNQSVPAGQKAKTGSTIVLTVASGFNAVPSVVGMTRDEAETAIQDAGFAVQIGTDTEDPGMSPGDPDVVASQSPAAGRKQLGSTVTINIKHAPPGP